MVIIGPLLVRVTPESRRLMVLPRKGTILWAVHSHGPQCPVRLRVCLQAMLEASLPGPCLPASEAYPSWEVSILFPLPTFPSLIFLSGRLQDTPLRVCKEPRLRKTDI